MEPYVNGLPVTDIAPYADVKYSENLRRGCDTASWLMSPWVHNQKLYAGAPVTIKDGPTVVWAGLLGEPARNGSFQAYGYAQRGEGVRAIDGVGAPTMSPETAIQAAVARGAVPWKLRGTPFGGTVPGDVDPSLMLNALLDKHSESQGWEWRVNEFGVITDYFPDTTPTWAVHMAEDLWTYSDDNLVTHINVNYLGPGPAFASLQATNAESLLAAARWGVVEKELNLEGEGILTSTQANTYAQNLLSKTGPKLQLVEPIIVAGDQLRTLGDTKAGWTSVHPGQMIRLWGVPDQSKVTPTLHTDVVIGRIERDRSTLTLTPRGSESQTYEDYVAELFARLAA